MNLIDKYLELAIKILMVSVLLIVFSIVFSSCSKEDPEEVKVPDAARTEYNSFLSEAAKRNMKLKNRRLEKIVLQGVITSSQYWLVGEGFYINGFYDQDHKQIIFDTTSNAWKNNREDLVFHELGHAFLGRVHRNDLLPVDSLPASIMNFDRVANLYNFERDYYIDELFNENTSSPAWLNNWSK
jgi:hypothetical protein